uniref:Uncharacterized protein n=1 Tax=Phakopsora pachyrhizi TaxID=170000 RepID=A0A0S1MKV0_PHAPC
MGSRSGVGVEVEREKNFGIMTFLVYINIYKLNNGATASFFRGRLILLTPTVSIRGGLVVLLILVPAGGCTTGLICLRAAALSDNHCGSSGCLKDSVHTFVLQCRAFHVSLRIDRLCNMLSLMLLHKQFRTSPLVRISEILLASHEDDRDVWPTDRSNLLYPLHRHILQRVGCINRKGYQDHV